MSTIRSLFYDKQRHMGTWACFGSGLKGGLGRSWGSCSLYFSFDFFYTGMVLGWKCKKHAYPDNTDLATKPDMSALLRNTDPTVQRLLTPCFLTRCGLTPELWLMCPSWAVDCQLKFRFDEDGGFWRLTGGSGTVNGSAIASVDKMATGMITWRMDRCPRLTEMIAFFWSFENLCLIKPTYKVEKLIWNLFQRDLRHKRSSLTPNPGHSLLQRGIHLQRWWPLFLYRNISWAKSAFCQWRVVCPEVKSPWCALIKSNL